MPRTIVHADMDAFFASVEQLDRPELRGKPVVVGGPSDSRGVVAAASYEARAFGVRSAMPMSRALRLCPDAIRISPRFDRYQEVSRRVMVIFRAVTPLVEPLSMDEAFLDVTEQIDRYGGPEALARHLKFEVKTTIGLAVSVAVGSNKTVAKIASDMGKPDGLVIVPPGEEAAFLAPLPVRSLWGVGPKAEALLKEAGFGTVADIARAELEQIADLIGSRAGMLQEMARGIDDRPVVTEYERKSVGAENTFPRDLLNGPHLRAELKRMAERVARGLAAHGFRARTVVLKLRYSNFHTITRQMSRRQPTSDAQEIATNATALLDGLAKEGESFRLLGIHCTNLVEEPPEDADQLGLWEGGRHAS